MIPNFGRGPDPGVPQYDGPPTVTGMSLRDWFAGQAAALMLGGLVSARVSTGAHAPKDVAETAYMLADAMLAAREPK